MIPTGCPIARKSRPAVRGAPARRNRRRCLPHHLPNLPLLFLPPAPGSARRRVVRRSISPYAGKSLRAPAPKFSKDAMERINARWCRWHVRVRSIAAPLPPHRAYRRNSHLPFLLPLRLPLPNRPPAATARSIRGKSAIMRCARRPPAGRISIATAPLAARTIAAATASCTWAAPPSSATMATATTPTDA